MHVTYDLINMTTDEQVQGSWICTCPYCTANICLPNGHTFTDEQITCTACKSTFTAIELRGACTFQADITIDDCWKNREYKRFKKALDDVNAEYAVNSSTDCIDEAIKIMEDYEKKTDPFEIGRMELTDEQVEILKKQPEFQRLQVLEEETKFRSILQIMVKVLNWDQNMFMSSYWSINKGQPIDESVDEQMNNRQLIAEMSKCANAYWEVHGESNELVNKYIQVLKKRLNT